MNKILLTKDFSDNSRILIDTALYISVSKNRDGYAVYDGEAVKCISEFIVEFADYIENKYDKEHIINKFIFKTIDALNRSIDSKIDRKLYSRVLEDNLTDFFEEFLICFYRGFDLGFLQVIPVLDENDKVKYYCYDSKTDQYKLTNEVPYSNEII